MCVSAEASFGLTGVLAPVGVYCLGIAYRRDRRALPVAAVPLLFGVQQLLEGLVWVGVERGRPELARGAALGYLFFALQFWLFWIPLGAWFLEPRPRARLVLGVGALLGLTVGAVLFLPVVSRPETLRIAVVRHSLYYDYADPPALVIAPQIVWHLLYVAVIGLPLLVVKEKRLIGYGTALVVSAAVSHFYFWYSFASIWCFFAALVSLYLGYLFHGWPLRTPAEPTPRTPPAA